MLTTRVRWPKPSLCLLIAGSIVPCAVGLPGASFEESVLFLGHATRAGAGGEQTTTDNLLISRDDGGSFIVHVGAGCRGLVEGHRVTLKEYGVGQSAAAFVEDGPAGISCRVLQLKAVQIVSPDGKPVDNDAAGGLEHEVSRVVRALQRGLAILGYEPGSESGEVNPTTADALMRYRADKRHDDAGKDLRFTLWTLGMDILVENPRDANALSVADTLFGAASE